MSVRDTTLVREYENQSVAREFFIGINSISTEDDKPFQPIWN